MKTRFATVKGKTRAGYRDAEQKLTELKQELTDEAQAEEAASDPANYTLWDCIIDWHAWVITTPKTSQKTADKYLGQCRKWIKPRIGDLPLHKVDVATLSDLLEDMALQVGADTLQDILGAIRRAINYARRQRKIDRNEAEAVELPEAGVKPHDWDFLTQEQVETVLSYVEGTRMYAVPVRRPVSQDPPVPSWRPYARRPRGSAQGAPGDLGRPPLGYSPARTAPSSTATVSGGAAKSSSATPGSACSMPTTCGTRSRPSWTQGACASRRSRT
jgi:hypothetical protein